MTQKSGKNPFTGREANSFTQVTNRDLPAPRNVRPAKRDVGLQRRTRTSAKEYFSQPSDAPMGYRVDDTIHPGYQTFITGAKHMMPNTAASKNVPAINEPHEAESGVTVQRRAEDLSGKEAKKGRDVLVQYGHDPKDPMESLRSVHRRALNHGIAQNIAAGVHESSSQRFYGGQVTTSDMDHDPGSLEAHENGVMAANDRFHQGVQRIESHPDFASQTAHLSPRARHSAAVNVMAQATADTSPNTKWRDKPGAKWEWPNMQQAEASATAGIEGTTVPFISGRVQNHAKAAERVAQAMHTGDFSVHQHGDPVTAPKTVAFRGALVDKDSPDAFEVSDVHDASIHVAPWLPTSKAHMHAKLDEDGQQVGHKVSVYEDTPKAKRRGLTPLTKEVSRVGKVIDIPQWGLSRPEAMLAEGRSTVHALNDLASRQVLTERGLSRGVNYADNVHQTQALTWGAQQLHRPDVNVSPADQYPVTRKWANEGISVPDKGDIRNLGRGHVHDQLSREYGPNDRKGREQSVWPT